MPPKSKKKCNEDEILNPETNRCVKKSGSIGKTLLKKLEKKASNKKDCKDDEVRNPETNRCVKKSGTIGKRIIESQKKMRSRKKVTRKPRGKTSRKVFSKKSKIIWKELVNF